MSNTRLLLLLLLLVLLLRAMTITMTTRGPAAAAAVYYIPLLLLFNAFPLQRKLLQFPTLIRRVQLSVHPCNCHHRHHNCFARCTQYCIAVHQNTQRRTFRLWQLSFVKKLTFQRIFSVARSICDI